ncbi:MAG TPA: transcription-repair coupling factor, partial [Coxiellaceae bacterium]|nr:transcription-repair coupling factor [Coxiellaceae bacterium]
MQINPFQPIIPRETDTEVTWENNSPAETSLAIASLLKKNQPLLLLITPDVQTAEKYFYEIQFFLGENNKSVYLFPDRETLPYDHFSPHEDLTSDRLALLSLLPNLSQGIVIAAISTFMHRLPPVSYLQSYALNWAMGDSLDLTKLQSRLAENGYRHVEQVMQHGEFAVRGAIIDIFPMGSDTPFRVELFDNEIDSIRSFDVDTQKSIEKIKAIQLLPAHEYPLTE